jgi:adenosylcobinamide-GDP ribazoletransferase
MLLPGMHGVAALGIAVVAIFVLGQLLKRTWGANRRHAGGGD